MKIPNSLLHAAAAAAASAATAPDSPPDPETATGPTSTPEPVPGGEPPAGGPEVPPVGGESEQLVIDVSTLTDESLMTLGQAIDAERERRHTIHITPTILTEAVTAYIAAGGDLDELNSLLSAAPEPLPEAPSADTTE